MSCDDRGQLVLPKDLRKSLNIASGDKLALLKCETEDDKLCLTIIKSSSLEDLVKIYLGPILKDMGK